MSEALWLAAAAVLSMHGMGWLALAMDAHWGQVMHSPAENFLRTRGVLRALGAVTLSLSFLACLMADRPSIAALVWVMLLTASALAVALLLARWPKVLRVLCPAT